jgi:hypothetical protein
VSTSIANWVRKLLPLLRKQVSGYGNNTSKNNKGYENIFLIRIPVMLLI